MSSSFWTKPATLGKKKKRKAEVIVQHVETVITMPKHKAGIIPSNNSTIKRKRTKKGISIKVSASSGHRGAAWHRYTPGESMKFEQTLEGQMPRGLAAFRSRIESYKNDYKPKEEKQEGYEKRLNLGLDKKVRRYNKFSKNDRQPGRKVTESQVKQSFAPNDEDWSDVLSDDPLLITYKGKE